MKVQVDSRIFKLEKINGIFIVFCDYEQEENFLFFLVFLTKKLKVSIPEPTHYPYSIASEFTFHEELITASFSKVIGCFLRVKQTKQLLADELISLCK